MLVRMERPTTFPRNSPHCGDSGIRRYCCTKPTKYVGFKIFSANAKPIATMTASCMTSSTLLTTPLALRLVTHALLDSSMSPTIINVTSEETSVVRMSGMAARLPAHEGRAASGETLRRNTEEKELQLHAAAHQHVVEEDRRGGEHSGEEHQERGAQLLPMLLQEENAPDHGGNRGNHDRNEVRLQRLRRFMPQEMHGHQKDERAKHRRFDGSTPRPEEHPPRERHEDDAERHGKGIAPASPAKIARWKPSSAKVSSVPSPTANTYSRTHRYFHSAAPKSSAAMPKNMTARFSPSSPANGAIAPPPWAMSAMIAAVERSVKARGPKGGSGFFPLPGACSVSQCTEMTPSQTCVRRSPKIVSAATARKNIPRPCVLTLLPPVHAPASGNTSAKAPASLAARFFERMCIFMIFYHILT